MRGSEFRGFSRFLYFSPTSGSLFHGRSRKLSTRCQRWRRHQTLMGGLWSCHAHCMTACDPVADSNGGEAGGGTTGPSEADLLYGAIVDVCGFDISDRHVCILLAHDLLRNHRQSPPFWRNSDALKTLFVSAGCPIACRIRTTWQAAA